ncbi:transglutaminase domain-containing protein [uncultured Umboniibacter sp.]|uniref:transglutaminase domain-containing protein n=1 Tax=uncultured Umboniibacter sp. TaxID=1798917 RepID=UPI00260DC15B|nr:transglutaminase domain-containing protein [uncultured Umboniibacter sp.]
MKYFRSLALLSTTSLLLLGCAQNPSIMGFPSTLSSEEIKQGPSTAVMREVNVGFMDDSVALTTFAEELLAANDQQTFSPLRLSSSGDNIATTTQVSRIYDTTIVGTKRERKARIDDIINSFYRNDNYQFQYQAEGNFSAAEAFERQAGNCVSFSALVVKLARAQGLEASFQIVETLPGWDEVDSGTVMYIRHINANILVSAYESINVDINNPRDAVTVRTRLISDQEAEAEFLNNLAISALSEGNFDQAHQLLYQSLSLNENSGGTWSNLGTLYRRMGHDEWAEQAFLKGALAPHNFETAQSNLERFYRQRDQIAYADRLAEALLEYRENNPITHQRRAREQMIAGNFDSAINHLKIALEIAPNMHSTLYLMAISYEFNGDGELANSYQQAANNISEQRDTLRFEQKRQALLRHHNL